MGTLEEWAGLSFLKKDYDILKDKKGKIKKLKSPGGSEQYTGRPVRSPVQPTTGGAEVKLGG